MRQAVVVATHPGRRTVDLVYADTAMPVAEVSIAGWVSSDGGHWHIPSVPKPKSIATQSSPPDSGRQLIALVDQVGGRPIVVGFMSPPTTQMAFTEDDREVHRHSSGAYTTVAPDGSIETYHPSGAYFRIGSGAHQDLTSVSKEAAWKEVSDAAQPTITLKTQNFSLTIDPSGNVSLTCQGNLSMAAQGNASITAQGTMNLQSTGAMTIRGSTIDLN
jgi:hypothetical protein